MSRWLDYPRPEEVALDRELGRELVRARTADGLTRDCLANAAGLTPYLAATVEDGSTRLPTSRMIRLFDHTSTDPLTAFAHALAATTALDQPTPDSVLLLTNHNRLSAEVRERVRDLVVSVAAQA